MGLRLRRRRPSFRSPQVGVQPCRSRFSMARVSSSSAAMMSSTVSSAMKYHQGPCPSARGVVYSSMNVRFSPSSMMTW